MERLDKIISYKTWSTKKKMDALLEIDASLYTQLGTDSTKKEKQEVKKQSRKIYQAIKMLGDSNSQAIGASFLYAMDI